MKNNSSALTTHYSSTPTLHHYHMDSINLPANAESADLTKIAAVGDLPAIAMYAGIAVAQRAWRWQAGGRRVDCH